MTNQEMLILDECQRAGYAAYESKVPIQWNPCALSSARKAWEDGWKRAQHEYEDDPPEE